MLDNAAGQSTITNSTVTGNTARATTATTGGTTAGAEGGGIYVASSALRLVNATVARNRLTAQGAGHFAVGGGIYSSVATLQLRGTLLAGNSAARGTGLLRADGVARLQPDRERWPAAPVSPRSRRTSRNKNAKLGTFAPPRRRHPHDRA